MGQVRLGLDRLGLNETSWDGLDRLGLNGTSSVRVGQVRLDKNK